MFSYFRFLLKSSNQHGVHSPFVYNYITKGLYEPQKDFHNSNKTNKWLLQSIQYFQPTKICFLDEGISVVARKVYTNKSVDINSADLVIELYSKENENRILQTLAKMNNTQLLLIAVYKKYPEAFFNDLRKNPDVIVMIDFYRGCLISKRTEQLKQNFFIRY